MNHYEKENLLDTLNFLSQLNCPENSIMQSKEKEQIADIIKESKKLKKYSFLKTDSFFKKVASLENKFWNIYSAKSTMEIEKKSKLLESTLDSYLQFFKNINLIALDKEATQLHSDSMRFKNLDALNYKLQPFLIKERMIKNKIIEFIHNNEYETNGVYKSASVTICEDSYNIIKQTAKTLHKSTPPLLEPFYQKTMELQELHNSLKNYAFSNDSNWDHINRLGVPIKIQLHEIEAQEQLTQNL